MQVPVNDQNVQQTIQLLNIEESQDLFGPRDENLRVLQAHFHARIAARGDTITVSGDAEQVEAVLSIFEELLKLVRKGDPISRRDVEFLLEAKAQSNPQALEEAFAPVSWTLRGRKGLIKPKSPGQRQYLNAIFNHDVVFGIGPAGTGKTYLAVSAAVSALERKVVRRIILARPAVEAGESLGFLPGDLRAKVDPFLRPLYDALYDMLNPDLVQRYLEQGTVEIAPLAYMRGRTLNNSFIIMDEAQNTTPEQMKMFLTRLGFNSQAVITGDVTQIDLPHGRKSGLIEAANILKDVDDIAMVRLDKGDIVRHPLVQKIVEAYELQFPETTSPMVFDSNKEKPAE
ncbi:MAG: PhoH family protein [Candidatus Hinthialibacter antarcticus]|nr:PhoH family protein [Candidatus Hinthialibacter antarcticus]